MAQKGLLDRSKKFKKEEVGVTRSGIEPCPYFIMATAVFLSQGQIGRLNPKLTPGQGSMLKNGKR